jgi:hypothetical protein
MRVTHDTTAAVTSPRKVIRRRTSRWFYVGLAVSVIAVSVAGFAPSIIDRSRRIAPATSLSVAHGILAVAWLLVFLTQATLVATHRPSVHRRLGAAGAVLALIMVVVTYASVVDWARRGYDVSGDIARVFSTPPGIAAPTVPSAEFAAGIFGVLAGPVIWGVLIAAALWYRHRPDIHKRLMFMALASVLDVPLLHVVGVLVSWWPDLWVAGFVGSRVVVVAVLFASAINDKLSQGRVHPVSLWVALFLTVWEVAVVPVVISTPAWRDIAVRLILR